MIPGAIASCLSCRSVLVIVETRSVMRRPGPNGLERRDIVYHWGWNPDLVEQKEIRDQLSGAGVPTDEIEFGPICSMHATHLGGKGVRHGQ